MVLNTAQLDPSLQIGADRTASHVSAPLFVIAGDGGAATYECFIDGTAIGQYHTSSPYGDVAVQSPIALTDGPHTLTFNELSPHAGLATTPFQFKVDTVPPSIPSGIVVKVGSVNGSGKYPLSIAGLSDVGTTVRAYQGPYAGIGGAAVDTSGHFTIATLPLVPGSYSISVLAADKAGNTSARSVPISVTVGTPPPPPPPPPTPTVPGVPTASAHIGSIVLNWSVPPDGGSAITGYVIRRNGAVLGVTTGQVFTDSAPVTGGSYTIAATNAVGEGPQSSPVSL